ncbi:phosphorylase [Nostoc sp. FACHB-190]|uniref:ATP adenylyltransferase family protein n=1 Tax=Nostoc sp. FACHB-190 TaxID=2692838 RepID=UPI001683886B|nr:phosphorylase [Nostoc sp. FACHB-190]MBD2298764.1 phosphorylase [Nostoc sp. FACHB-190]
MLKGEIFLKTGTLWTSVKETTLHALKCGALLSIPTEFEFVEQDGVNFLVRILSNLTRKDAAKKQQDKQTNAGKDFNPFLPYEQDLFVAEISDTHVCILNKFNVVDYHLLLITRAFEEQESLLTPEDFAALLACFAEFEGLAFYNSGKIAGASQRHKHLQIVPLPLAPAGVQIPIQPLFASAELKDGVGKISQLPFVNAFATLDPNCLESPLTSAEAICQVYHNLLSAVGIEIVDSQTPSAAYNLLATKEWMLIVPRSQEKYQSISVNSLGFAGALLVRNEQEMQLLKNTGPMNILKEVAVQESIVNTNLSTKNHFTVLDS